VGGVSVYTTLKVSIETDLRSTSNEPSQSFVLTLSSAFGDFTEASFPRTKWYGQKTTRGERVERVERV
jgi:hypothetical protein